MQQEHARRNGSTVVGFGVGAPSPAEVARDSIRVRLDRPPWLRGVGIALAADGTDVVLIYVQRHEHLLIARAIVGDQAYGVPVHYEAVGDIRAGNARDDFGVGARWSPDWRTPGAKLAAMERLVAEGRGDEFVEGGGCTEPGGGIVPTQRTAREMAKLLRGRRDSGLGAEDPKEPERHSPWKEAIIMSVAGAVTGWVLDEIAHRTFLKRRRR